VDSGEQLEWEARFAKPAAAAAFISALLLVAAIVVRQGVALADRPDNDKETLLAIHDNSGALIASAVIQAFCFLALIGVLYYLFRAIQARKPDFPSWALPLLVAGPVLLALAGILSDLERVDIADKFVSSGAESVNRAEDLLDDRDAVSTAVGSGGTLTIAIAFVLISINAMRAGLVSRFMGILGVIIGVLYVLPILPGLIVQVFWLGAIGGLFLGIWPGGRGPAWEKVQAIPWPSQVQRAAANEETAGSIPPEPELEGEADSEPKNPRKSKKRKRR
jgi:hypothetical protein